MWAKPVQRLFFVVQLDIFVVFEKMYLIFKFACKNPCDTWHIFGIINVTRTDYGASDVVVRHSTCGMKEKIHGKWWKNISEPTLVLMSGALKYFNRFPSKLTAENFSSLFSDTRVRRGFFGQRRCHQRWYWFWYGRKKVGDNFLLILRFCSSEKPSASTWSGGI